jgi:hypothetical protein
LEIFRINPQSPAIPGWANTVAPPTMVVTPRLAVLRQNPLTFPYVIEHPEQLTAEDRAAEITAILARAILRVHDANLPAEPVEREPVRVGFCPGRSVHTTPSQPETL